MNPKQLHLGKIASMILYVRGHKVMLDRDLAQLYGVPVKALIQAVKRNLKRFPADFMFLLRATEAKTLRSQFVTLKKRGRGQHSKYLPYVFTEQGVAMLSSVLRSSRAIEVNIAIMRAFVRLREILSTNTELARKLRELENKLEKHDAEIQAIFEAIHKLMKAPEPVPDKPKRRIGFHA